MRSYRYEEGRWEPCKDALPHEPKIEEFKEKSDFPNFAAYEIVSKAYHAALERLGFLAQPEKFMCHIGELEVYTRDHVKLSVEREDADFPYDFLCVLHFSGSYIRVWIVDLPTLLLFLREVEAHRTETTVAEAIKEVIPYDALNEMLQYTGEAMKELWLGKIEITVKPPKPPTPPQTRRVQR